jgi:hypothetical protein
VSSAYIPCDSLAREGRENKKSYWKILLFYSCGKIHFMSSKFSHLLWVFSVIAAATATATTVPNLTFEEMTDRSELVVTGQVTRSWSDWDSEHKYIWTQYEIAVKSTQKGRAGATVVVSEPGGVVGDRALSIAGAVGYAQGEQVAVFLQRMPNGYLRTTGWGQGKFGVDTTGHLHAAAATRGFELINNPAVKTPGTSLHTLEGISLTDFKGRIAARTAVNPGSAK